jgi:hypothetical protein
MARGAALLFQLEQGFKDRRQIHVPRRPVHEIKVDVIELQLLQAGIERPANCIRREVFVPDFGGDVQILACDARCCDGGADGVFVAIHFRGVDVPIAETQRAFARRAAGLALHAKGAEPKRRQADAVGLQMFHDDS